ncbi:MAG: helix-turn-helix domain-containing protein [Patescibacteria group bacterium]
MNPVNFSRKTLPQKEGLGEKLAKKRVALGYSIRDAEKATRIRADYIEDIESGKYDRLPPDVFVKGFIKSYAEFLKLDPKKVMQLYQRERGLIENVKKASAEKPTSKRIKKPRIVITPKTVIISLIIFAALTIVAYIGWQVRILTAPPKLTVSSPVNNTSVKTDSIAIEGVTDPGATLYINDVEVGVNQDGDFKEKISLQNGVNQIKIRAQNKLGRYNELSRIIVAEVKNTLPANTAPAGIELKLNVGPKSASLQIEIDGKKVTDKAIIILPGVSQTYKAAEKITVSTNNGGSVRAVVNGQDIGALGKDNETVKREFVKGMQIK